MPTGFGSKCFGWLNPFRWLWLGTALGAPAAAPVLDQLFPVALQLGTTNSVEAIGKIDPWPPQTWTDAPGIHVEPSTNKGTVRVTVDPNVTPGAHFLRLYNEEGASAPRFLLITSDASVAEVEPNDLYTKPQSVASLPAHINGRLEKSGDVDSFGVSLTAGQTLIATVEAHTLMSPFDSVLRLLDSRGVQVAFNHDDGRTLDSRVVWTAPSAGPYVLQVFGFDYPAGSDVRFAGNAKCIYRLHLQTGPFLHHTLPLGVQRGAKTQLISVGPGQAANTHGAQTFDGTSLEPSTQTVEFRAAGFANPLTLPVGEGPETVEVEANNTTKEASILAIPGAVSGTINPGRDVDRFRFVAREGEAWTVAVSSASFGFPLDAWLKIEDLQGKELAGNDDADGADPQLNWTAPAGTNFVAVVGGLGRQGGPECLYRLSFRRPTPGLKATVADNSFTVEPGKTNEVKLTVNRLHGLTNSLRVEVTGLPADVRAEPLAVTDKGGDTVLKLVAATNAAAFNGVIQFQIADVVTAHPTPVTMELVTGGENNGVPQGFRHLVRESIEQFWLTVRLPKPPEAKK